MSQTRTNTGAKLLHSKLAESFRTEGPTTCSIEWKILQEKRDRSKLRHSTLVESFRTEGPTMCSIECNVLQEK